MSTSQGRGNYDIGVLMGLADQNGVTKIPGRTDDTNKWDKIASHYKLLVPNGGNISGKELKDFFYSIINHQKVNTEKKPKVIQVKKKTSTPSVVDISQVKCSKEHWDFVLEDFQQKSLNNPFEVDGTGANVILCGDEGYKATCHEIVIRKFTKIFEYLGPESFDEVRDPYNRIVFILAGFDQNTLKALVEILYTGQTLVDVPDCVEVLRQLLADDIHFVASVTAKLDRNCEFDTQDPSVYCSDLLDYDGTDALSEDTYDICKTRMEEEVCDQIDSKPKEQEGPVDKDDQKHLGYYGSKITSNASDEALNITISADNNDTEEIISPEMLSKGSKFQNMDEAINMFSKFCKQNFCHWMTRSSHKEHSQSFRRVHLTCIHFGNSDRQSIPLVRKIEKKQCPFGIKIAVPKGGVQAVVTEFINKHQNHSSGKEYYQSIPLIKRLTYDEIVQIGPKILEPNLDPDLVLSFIKEKTGQEFKIEDLHKIRRSLKHKITIGERKPSITITRPRGKMFTHEKEGELRHVSDLVPNLEQINKTESDEEDIFDMLESPASKWEEKFDETDMENNQRYKDSEFIEKYDNSSSKKICDSESSDPISTIKYDEEGKISSDTFKKGSKFKDIEEATEFFSKFCQQNFFYWTTRSSHKYNDPQSDNVRKLHRATLTCVHYGIPKNKGAGLRMRSEDAKLKRQCPFEIRFLVISGGRYAIVTEFINKHRNHGSGEEYYKSLRKVKRLTVSDLVPNLEQTNKTEGDEEDIFDMLESPASKLEEKIDEADMENNQGYKDSKFIEKYDNSLSKKICDSESSDPISTIKYDEEGKISSDTFKKGSKFKDIEEATEIFAKFCQQNFYYWTTRSSHKYSDPKSDNVKKLHRATLTCVHYGIPKNKGAGLRMRSEDAKLKKQCPFEIRFLVSRGGRYAIVTEFINEHRNHGSGEEYYKSLQKVKRLTENEIVLVGAKILTSKDTKSILAYVKEKTGKELNGQDLKNVRRRLEYMMAKEEESPIQTKVASDQKLHSLSPSIS